MPVERRIQIFDFMASFFEIFQIPVIFQTCSNQLFDDHPSIGGMVTKKDCWWDIKNVSHLALLLLCYKIDKYMEDLRKDCPEHFSDPFPTFVDEGLLGAETTIELPNWPRTFKDMQLKFVNSRSSKGIQLADFAAFCIARSQWIMVKTDPGVTLSPADLHVLSCSSKMNILNLIRTDIDPSKFSRENYEFIMMRDRNEKGLNYKPQ